MVFSAPVLQGTRGRAMRFDISEQQRHKSKIPHEIFLTNLIGNHILWFIAALGLARTYWQPLALVPVASVILLGYILWRAARSKKVDPWYVMCHWQICAKRSRVFIYMLFFVLLVAGLGWAGYVYLGMMKEAVYALVGGLGILPVMVTVLVLIIMESDLLHQASQGKLPDRVLDAYPNPGERVLED